MMLTYKARLIAWDKAFQLIDPFIYEVALPMFSMLVKIRIFNLHFTCVISCFREKLTYGPHQQLLQKHKVFLLLYSNCPNYFIWLTRHHHYPENKIYPNCTRINNLVYVNVPMLNHNDWFVLSLIIHFSNCRSRDKYTTDVYQGLAS